MLLIHELAAVRKISNMFWVFLRLTLLLSLFRRVFLRLRNYQLSQTPYVTPLSTKDTQSKPPRSTKTGAFGTLPLPEKGTTLNESNSLKRYHSHLQPDIAIRIAPSIAAGLVDHGIIRTNLEARFDPQTSPPILHNQVSSPLELMDLNRSDIVHVSRSDASVDLLQRFDGRSS